MTFVKKILNEDFLNVVKMFIHFIIHQNLIRCMSMRKKYLFRSFFKSIHSIVICYNIPNKCVISFYKTGISVYLS